jgi:hypothetical protein
MYFDRANNYWVAAVSLGYKAGKWVRRKVTGRTKTEVKAKWFPQSQRHPSLPSCREAPAPQ